MESCKFCRCVEGGSRSGKEQGNDVSLSLRELLRKTSARISPLEVSVLSTIIQRLPACTTK
jgi:hypothetical protein